MEKLAQAEGLRTNFYTFEGVVKALNGVSLVVNNGETYGLVGESGCGKSVSVRSMMRIVQAPGRIEEGKVVLYFSEKDKTKGIDIIQRSEAYMQSIRGNDISMIFQEASTALNPVLSIGFQVGESFLLHRRDEMVRQAIQRIEKDLEESGNPIVSGWKNFHKTLLQKELNSLEAYNAKVAEIDNELYLLEGKEDQKSVSRHKHLIAAR
ncbi:MAG: ABC transporter ATP-binding protein, partial [Spirochaetales bacterium]|nr:ABC transporter ATP-binding protein [Spirochaetales bacterium]